jgi:hypothetical protein
MEFVLVETVLVGDPLYGTKHSYVSSLAIVKKGVHPNKSSSSSSNVVLLYSNLNSKWRLLGCIFLSEVVAQT